MTIKRVTMDEIARRCGVSKATVSAVLNDTGTVRESTRDRVLAVMEEVNYRPGAQVRRRGVPGRRSIGLIIKELDNPYYGAIAAGARACAIEHGYTILVTSSEGVYEAEREAMELMQEKEVDGLVLTPVLDGETDLSHLFELKRRNYPFVLLEEIRGVRASLVDIDNVVASRRAVEHLISQGHTEIVHFAGPTYSMHSEQRVDGMRRAFSASRLVLPEEAVVPAGAHLADGYRAGLAHFGELGEDSRPTAAACYNDLVAIGVCRALTELGLRVPEDVAVIGWDDLEILRYLPVPLTSVRVPTFEMGRRATEMLIRHIEAREALTPEKVYLEAEIVVRGSTSGAVSAGGGGVPVGDALRAG